MLAVWIPHLNLDLRAHDIACVAEEALARARKVKEAGEPAVEAELQRLDALEKDVSGLAQAISGSDSMVKE